MANTLFNDIVIVNGKGLYLKVDKVFDTHIDGSDYYEYHCEFYTKGTSFGLFSTKKTIYTYETYWLNYFDYYGDIDKVIREAIKHFKKHLSEQKYISEKENEFMKGK